MKYPAQIIGILLLIYIISSNKDIACTKDLEY